MASRSKYVDRGDDDDDDYKERSARHRERDRWECEPHTCLTASLTAAYNKRVFHATATLTLSTLAPEDAPEIKPNDDSVPIDLRDANCRTGL